MTYSYEKEREHGSPASIAWWSWARSAKSRRPGLRNTEYSFQTGADHGLQVHSFFIQQRHP